MSSILEAFDNPNPERRYTIEFTFPEFTSLCPKTGQPDFATIVIWYVPGPRCVELRSLKHYFWSFRESGNLYGACDESDFERSGSICAIRSRWR